MSVAPGDSDPRLAKRLPRGRHRLPSEHVAESQRWRLLVASGEVLLARGYGGLTVGGICRRAGVSTATFYDHFGDAEACLLAAYATAADCVWELVCAGCTGPGTWPERLRGALDAATGFLVAEPTLARLLCVDVAVGAAAVGAARERLLERLAGLLCSGRRLRLQSADQLPVQLEALLAGAVVSLFVDRILTGELEALPLLSAELAEILAAPYVDETGSRSAVTEARCRGG